MIKLTEKTKVDITNFEVDIARNEHKFHKPYDCDVITIGDSASHTIEQDSIMIQLIYVRPMDRTFVVINEIEKLSEEPYDVDYGTTIFSDWMQGYDAASIIRLIEEGI